MQAIGQRIGAQFPQTNGAIGVEVIPLMTQVTGGVRPLLMVVWAAVLLILVIMCVNVSHLVLARGASRARETAIRASLGATRLQITRGLLTENLILATFGGAFGL